MKNRRLRNYLQQKAERKASSTTADTKSNPAKHTNQDFNGYPHAPAKEEIINPKTTQEKKVAAVDSKDGEKIINPQEKKKTKLPAGKVDEGESDGSASAFDATEHVQEEE